MLDGKRLRLSLDNDVLTMSKLSRGMCWLLFLVRWQRFRSCQHTEYSFGRCFVLSLLLRLSLEKSTYHKARASCVSKRARTPKFTRFYGVDARS